MSQSTEEAANIGLKRAQPARVASPPRRPRKRRNVVESSPQSEPSPDRYATGNKDVDSLKDDIVDTQLESMDDMPPEDSHVPDDSEEDILDTQLQRMDDVQPNDPSIDWRQLQDGQGEGEDTDEEMEVEVTDHRDAIYISEQGHVVPDEVLEAERIAAEATSTHEHHVVHRVYRAFLANLCSQTSTQSSESVVLEGLPWIIWRNRSIELELNLRSQRTMDLYAHALVIHVWLVVCRRIQRGELPSDATLVLEMGSYFVSAHSIMQESFSASYDELKDAVRYWEERPAALGRRHPWQDETWLQKLPQPDITAETHRNETAEAYLEALTRGGKAELAAQVILKDQQNVHRTPLRKFTHGDTSDFKWALEVLISILAAMNTEVIKALIDGSLTRKAEILHNDVSNALDAMKYPTPQDIKDKKPTPPAIYMNSLCDHMGVSPTPLQWQTVCNLMFEYVSPGTKSNDLALEVDQLIHPDDRWPPGLAKKGLRRYTEWRTYVTDEDKYPNESHRDMVRYFATEMQTRVNTEKAAGRGHTPLEAPVVEIGFSINWRKRLREHRQHQNSNYLMNLAEALFRYAFPGSFRLQQLVIYTCYQVSQCWFSEIMLTQLGQGYTDAAGGFSHYPAGRSNGSAYKATGAQDWVRLKYEAYCSGALEAELRKIAGEARRDELAAIEKHRKAEEARGRQRDILQSMNEVLDDLLKLSEATIRLQRQGGDNG